MNSLDCPFRAMEEFLEMERPDAPIIVDFHAEATSEKITMGWYLDGRVTALMGTHTPSRPLTTRVLPRGAGYITDANVTRPPPVCHRDGRKGVLERFYTQMPQKFRGKGKDDVEVQGVPARIDRNGHRCLDIKRVKEK